MKEAVLDYGSLLATNLLDAGTPLCNSLGDGAYMLR